MKKIFTLLSLALVAFAAQAQGTTHVVVKVDDPTHFDTVVACKDGVEFETKTFETNEVSFDVTLAEGEYGSYMFAITTKAPYIIAPGATYTEDGTEWEIGIYNLAKSSYEFYIYPGYTAETVYNFLSVSEDDYRKNSATINIYGDPDNVSAYMTNIYQRIAGLQPGENTFKFADVEGAISVTAQLYQKPLYKVCKNDTELTPDGTTWYLTLENGDVLDIYEEWPEGEATIKFEFKGDASTKVLDYMSIGETYYRDFSEPFVAKIGQLVNLSISNVNYNINSFAVNGEVQPEYMTSYAGVLTEDLTFVIDATKKECYTATVNVNDYTLIKYAEAGVQDILPTSNTFTVEVAKDMASYYPIYICPLDYSCQIDECTPGEYWEYDRLYCVNITEEVTEINVKASRIDRPDMLSFYFNSPKNATEYLSGYWFGCEFPGRQWEMMANMKAGYNFFDFGDVDGQFQFGLYGNEPDIDKYAYVYLNDEKCPSPYYSSPILFTPQDGDVFKVYINGGVEPSRYTATFSVEDATVVKGAYIDGINEITVADEAEFKALQETGFTLLLADGYIVKLNGEQIDPMEEPVLARSEEGTVYYFNLVKDLSVEILKDESGINTIAADDNAADPAVYNILGVKVSNGSTDNLPAGLYIQKGQKFYVK